MTTIAIFSDIHLEFGTFEPSKAACDADIVILAGDIGSKHYGLRWAAETFKNQIIYVAGNHEFYDARRDIVLTYLRKEANKPEYEGRVHFLNNDQVIIDGIRFLGTTLWTDFNLHKTVLKQAAMSFASSRMNDYRLIQRGAKEDGSPYKNLLSPRDTLHSNEVAVTWLEERLFEEFNGATVVISHHAPSRMSLPKYQRKDMLSAAYASNLDYLVKQTTLWCHGHIHGSKNYKIEDATVLCNPRGYVRNGENQWFRDNLIVKIVDGKLVPITDFGEVSFKELVKRLEAVNVYDEEGTEFVLERDIVKDGLRRFQSYQMTAQMPVVRGGVDGDAHYASDYRRWLAEFKSDVEIFIEEDDYLGDDYEDE